MPACVWCHLGDRDDRDSAPRSLQKTSQVSTFYKHFHNFTNFTLARLSLSLWPVTPYLRWWRCIFPKTAITPQPPIFLLKQQIQFTCKKHKTWLKGNTYQMFAVTTSHKLIKQREKATSSQRWGAIKEWERCMTESDRSPAPFVCFVQ